MIQGSTNIEEFDMDLLLNIFKHFSLSELTALRATSSSFNIVGRNTQLLDHAAQAYFNFSKVKFAKMGFYEAIEAYLHLVMGNGYFETLRLSWKEQDRELSILEKRSDLLSNKMIKKLNGAQNKPITKANFLKRNKIINTANALLCRSPELINAVNNTAELNLKNMGLTRLPFELIRIIALANGSLTKVDLEGNKFKYLPTSFLLNNYNIKELNLKNNFFEFLPKGIADLNALESFDITGNLIKWPTAEEGLKLLNIGVKPGHLKSNYDDPFTPSKTMMTFFANAVLYFILTSDFLENLDCPYPLLLDTLIFLLYYSNAALFGITAIGPIFNLLLHNHLMDNWKGIESCPTAIKQYTPQASAYMEGRKINGVLPYFKRHFQNGSNLGEFKAGVEDTICNRPSRIKFPEPSFKEKLTATLKKI